MNDDIVPDFKRKYFLVRVSTCFLKVIRKSPMDMDAISTLVIFIALVVVGIIYWCVKSIEALRADEARNSEDVEDGPPTR